MAVYQMYVHHQKLCLTADVNGGHPCNIIGCMCGCPCCVSSQATAFGALGPCYHIQPDQVYHLLKDPITQDRVLNDDDISSGQSSLSRTVISLTD